MSRKDHDLSQGTLNPLPMMGLPNRALERISRSWSFCANSIEAGPAQDLVRGDDPCGIALSQSRKGFGLNDDPFGIAR
jgi:hypothetical protein